MKKIKISKTVVFARFTHVVQNLKDGAPLRVQAVDEDSKLLTVKCNAAIYQRVRGERHGDKGQSFSLGLRNIVHGKFRAHFDENDVIQAVDIVPNRMFTSGVAPKMAGDAIKKGFDIHVDDELNGFDIWKEDTRDDVDGIRRVAYAGMSERELYEVLDAMRAATWGNKNTLNLVGHKIDKVEDGLFRCRKIGAVKYIA